MPQKPKLDMPDVPQSDPNSHSQFHNHCEKKRQSLEQQIATLQEQVRYLSSKEEKYRSIHSNIAAITYRCEWDRDWTFRIMSDFSEKLTGYPASDFINNRVRSWESIMHRDDTGYIARIVDEALNSGKVFELEYRIIHRDGKIRWVYEKGNGVPNEAGEVVFLDGVIFDITHRKEAEIALRESEKKFRFLMDSNVIAIIYTDPSGQILEANNAFLSMLGYQQLDLKNRVLHISNLIHPSHRRMHQLHIERCQVETPIDPFELECIHRDGSTIPVMIAVTQQESDPAGYIYYITDLSKIKKSEMEKAKLAEELRQSQKMEAIGTLAGGIAHDFNNILGMIMGYTELSMDEQVDQSNTSKYLSQIMQSSIRAKEMVQQILAFSRKNSMDFSPVKLGKMVRNTVRLLRSSIPSTIRIETSLTRRSALCNGNETQLAQVLINLATNAVHSMTDKGGILSVQLDSYTSQQSESDLSLGLKAGEYNKITVSDSGSGIPEGIIKQVFEPYFTTKKTGEGTGMGLAVVYGIIKSHGGQIRLHSIESKGTTVDVYLPALSASNSEEKFSKPGTGFVQGNETILLVDDEVQMVNVVSLTLKSLGYQVFSSTDSADALKEFEANPDRYDLLITDLTMPGMTGTQLAARISQIDPDFPIILCTGFNNQANAILEQPDSMNGKGHQGIRKILIKPVNKKTFATAIREVLAD